MSAPVPAASRVYTTRQLSELLGVSMKTVRLMNKLGELPGVLSRRGQGRWSRTAIDNWLSGKGATYAS
jgi:excisionase family DNA binding protein